MSETSRCYSPFLENVVLLFFTLQLIILDEEFKTLFSFLIAWNSHIQLILLQLFFLFMFFQRASYEVKNP